MSKIHEEIVLVGGGGGVYRIARFLKNIRPNITTVQTMFDHGGHSGKLRDEHGILPPGDIRQAILALSDESMGTYHRAILSYRFPANGTAVDGATMGNLMLTALTDICGNPIMAIDAMCKFFGVKGKVLPVSLDDAELCATLSDGSTLKGEGLIDTRSPEDDRGIKAVYLEPGANIYTGTYEALVKADKIVFCPGDLYTSIIPNALVSGFKEAIQSSRAKLVYVLNMMTKKAETHGFSASKFASTLLEYLELRQFDTVVCNSAEINSEIKQKYERELAKPVTLDKTELQNYTREIVCDNLADQASGILRHNARTASIIANL